MALLSILADVLWHFRYSAVMTLKTGQPDRLFIACNEKRRSGENGSLLSAVAYDS